MNTYPLLASTVDKYLPLLVSTMNKYVPLLLSTQLQFIMSFVKERPESEPTVD
jgi:hypothetical protein